MSLVDCPYEISCTVCQTGIDHAEDLRAHPRLDALILCKSVGLSPTFPPSLWPLCLWPRVAHPSPI